MMDFHSKADLATAGRIAAMQTIEAHSGGFTTLRLLLADMQRKADTNEPVDTLDVTVWAAMLRWIVTATDDDNDRALEVIAAAR